MNLSIILTFKPFDINPFIINNHWFCLSRCAIQSNPGYSNYHGKVEIISSYRGFEEKDQKHLIKEVLCFYMFNCKVSSNVRAWKPQVQQSSCSSECLPFKLTLTLLKNLFTWSRLTWKIVRHKSLAFRSHSVSVNNVSQLLNVGLKVNKLII